MKVLAMVVIGEAIVRQNVIMNRITSHCVVSVTNGYTMLYPVKKTASDIDEQKYNTLSFEKKYLLRKNFMKHVLLRIMFNTLNKTVTSIFVEICHQSVSLSCISTKTLSVVLVRRLALLLVE